MAHPFFRTRRTLPADLAAKPIPAEVERLARLSDYELCMSGTDRVTLGAQALRALHAI